MNKYYGPKFGNDKNHFCEDKFYGLQFDIILGMSVVPRTVHTLPLMRECSCIT